MCNPNVIATGYSSATPAYNLQATNGLERHTGLLSPALLLTHRIFAEMTHTSFFFADGEEKEDSYLDSGWCPTQFARTMPGPSFPCP